MPQVHRALGPYALGAPQSVVSVHDRLHVSRVLLVDPGREVALGLIHLAGPRRTVVHVHAHLHVVAVLLHVREVPDLLKAGVPGLARGHAAVDRDGAGVSNRAAARAGVEYLAGGAGAAAQEAGVLVVLRVVLRVEHLHKALDLHAVVGGVLVERPDVLQDVRHLVDRVVAALRRGAVAGHALDVDADLHASPVAAVDAAVGRLGGDDELGDYLVLVVDVLPAHAVAVLFLDGADDHDLVSLRDEVEVLHDLRAVDGGGHAALLVGTAAAVDDLVVLVALVGVVGPVCDVADAHRVDVGVDGDDLLAVAHPADDVAEAVDLDLVIAELFHLGLDAGHYFFFLAALARVGDHGAKESAHIGLVSLGGGFDLFEVHFAHPPM